MTSHEALIEAAETLSASFALRSDEIEAARRVPKDISDELAAAGFYRIAAPAAVGGLEAAPATSSEVFEILARGEASCAWVSFIGATSGTVLSALPDAAAAEVFPNENTLIAGVFAPNGIAEKVDGGFRVSGRWQWGSGTQNADWILGGTMLTENGEPMLDRHGRQRQHMVLLPAAEVEFLDTWHVSGLRGTGSLDFQVTDLLVPEDRVVGFKRPGSSAKNPLYQFPNFTFLALGIGAVCMGIARAAMDELVQLAVAKKRVGTRNTIAEQQTSQITLAKAEACFRSARLFYYDALASAWDDAVKGNPVTVEKRRDLRLATTHAVQTCVQVVGDMYELGGGSSVYETSKLQRHFRDINVAKSHIMVSQNTLETAGSLFFGLETNTSRL